MRGCLLAGVVVLVALRAPAQELIDQVWAGHPVSFALLVDDARIHVAYYDAERRLTVGSRAVAGGDWIKVQPPGVPVPARGRDSNVTGWDSHNYLRLARDRDGHLHLAGNMHNDPLVYYRTRAPGDITTLERIDRMTGERESECTYPVFFEDAAGNLLFRYRDGGSGRGSDLYNHYDPDSRTWSRLLDTPLLDGEGARNAYALDPVLGPDGRFHLVWMWRDTPDCATNHTLSYARSRDFLHWETSQGAAIALPITLARGEVIDPARPGEGLINMTFNLGFNAHRQPVVVYHRYDGSHRSQAFAARPRAGEDWLVRAISAWDFCWAFSGNGSIAAEVMLGAPRLNPDGSMLVDYATDHAGDGRWRFDGVSLERLEQLPAAAGVLPPALAAPLAATPGMEVQTVVVRQGGKRWVLRWETLPRHRDQPRDVAPPPTELRLYELPAADTSQAARVGS